MTIRRAVLYTGGGTLLVAWFSSAASVSLQWSPRPAQTANVDTPSPVDDLAADMQAQARRLKQRLAAAPPPQRASPKSLHVRNRRAAPACGDRSVPSRCRCSSSVRAGSCTDRHGGRPAAQGVVRTAMIVTDVQDLIVAAVGDTVLQRYKVTAIGPDAVELADAATASPAVSRCRISRTSPGSPTSPPGSRGSLRAPDRSCRRPNSARRC